MANNRVLESERYLEAASKNMTELATAILLSSSPILNGDRLDEAFFRQRCADRAIKMLNTTQLVTILTAMDPNIIQAVIEGDLPKKARSSLKKFVKVEKARPDTEPVVYINYIVDDDGDAPTKGAVMRILQVMKTYIGKVGGSRTLAAVIDVMYGGDGAGHNWRYCRNNSQHAAQSRFILGMEDRVKGESNSTPITGGIS